MKKIPFFYLSKGERRGIITLLVLIGLLFIVRYGLEHRMADPEPLSEFHEFKDEIHRFENSCDTVLLVVKKKKKKKTEKIIPRVQNLAPVERLKME